MINKMSAGRPLGRLTDGAAGPVGYRELPYAEGHGDMRATVPAGRRLRLAALILAATLAGPLDPGVPAGCGPGVDGDDSTVYAQPLDGPPPRADHEYR
jgi:hypothetical protein